MDAGLVLHEVGCGHAICGQSSSPHPTSTWGRRTRMRAQLLFTKCHHGFADLSMPQMLSPALCMSKIC